MRVILYRIGKDWRAWDDPSSGAALKRKRKYPSWTVRYKAAALEREFLSRRDLLVYELTIDQFLENLLLDWL